MRQLFCQLCKFIHFQIHNSKCIVICLYQFQTFRVLWISYSSTYSYITILTQLPLSQNYKHRYSYKTTHLARILSGQIQIPAQPYWVNCLTNQFATGLIFISCHSVGKLWVQNSNHRVTVLVYTMTVYKCYQHMKY